MNIESNTQKLTFKPISRSDFNLNYTVPYLILFLVSIVVFVLIAKSLDLFKLVMSLASIYVLYGAIIRVRTLGYTSLWIAIPLTLLIFVFKITFIALVFWNNKKSDALIKQYHEENPEYNHNYFK